MSNKYLPLSDIDTVLDPLMDTFGGHGGRVVTLLPPTSEAGVSIPVMTSSGKAGSCLPLVGSLQYRTLRNSVLVPSALPTTRCDMTCTVLKAT